MSESALVDLVAIVVLGVGAQWLAQRLRIAAILLLLPAGMFAGTALGIQPEELFGDSLFPAISLAVGLLLFQSGLQMRSAELPDRARRPVIRLITVGVTLTFLLGSIAAAIVLPGGTTPQLVALVGAILVIGGPTVVGPLVATIRPRPPTDSVLVWEGNILDPVGAMLAVVALNVVLAGERQGAFELGELAIRLLTGALVGIVAAIVLLTLLSRFLITDAMEPAVAILLAVAAFGVSESLLSESGLFATLVMGITLANQRRVPTHRLLGVGETLEILIIGALFVVLGALVEWSAVLDYATTALILSILLVLLVRPASVFAALWRTELRKPEKAMIAAVAPRGVVAAATATSFALLLSERGVQADFLAPVVFGVIFILGIVYGLLSLPVANVLHVRRPRPRGVALVGSAPWLNDLAVALRREGVPTVLLDSGPGPADDSERISIDQPLEAIRGALYDRDIGGALIAVSDDAAADLLTADLSETLGRRHVSRLLVTAPGPTVMRLVDRLLPLPQTAVTQAEVAQRWTAAGSIGTVPSGAGGCVLAEIDDDGFARLVPPKPGAGRLIGVRND